MSQTPQVPGHVGQKSVSLQQTPTGCWFKSYQGEVSVSVYTLEIRLRSVKNEEKG